MKKRICLVILTVAVSSICLTQGVRACDDPPCHFYDYDIHEWIAYGCVETPCTATCHTCDTADTCECVDDDSKCEGDCEECDDGECECVVVTGINGLDDNHYFGTQVTVTASLSGSGELPEDCSITWGGDASFSNVNGTSATAYLNRLGSGKTITATTGCQETPCKSDPFTVARIAQFNADPAQFPKCVNMSISKSDFVIVTDPTGYEGDVEVGGLSTAIAGTRTATAKLWGAPNPPVTAAYDVLASGSTFLMSGLPLPNISDESVSGSSIWHTRTVHQLYLPPRYERAQVTYAGGVFWEEIGEWFNVPPGGSVTATWARGWTISTTVGVGVKTGVPGFEVTFEASISGGWQGSTTLSQEIPAPTTPGFVYDIRYYQKLVGINETVVKERATSPDGPWSLFSSDINELSDCGLASFNTGVWKKCP